ncbi:hypothetical protein ACGFU4_35965 [Streptomyces sp. NPDC048511]|uniref:hypothetical protein n=1 Tax=Streptomyces sp. NPDC048511 TaxID=3365562 RepID=UPI0037195962
MDDQTKAALRLLAELQRLNGADTLSNPNQTPAVRVTIRTANGEFIGEALLNPRAADEAANAAGVVAEYATAMPADYQAGRTVTPELDPFLVADIEDTFADVDPESYLADVFSSPDAEASLAAYEQMVTGEFDGGQL